MPKISAVIICYNEERNIGRCIDSLQTVADEIVVVDSFSTDKTAEICREKGIKFIEHAFDGHIEQKNFAITQASFPHVLSLDADEALDETLQQEIRKIKENWQKDGYSMNRLNRYCGKWIHYGAWYPEKKLRLWDSRKGQWGGTNPHDQFIMEKNATKGHLKGNLLHHRFESIEEHIRKLNYFTDIAAKAYLQKGKKCRWWHLIINPIYAFVSAYFFKRGFLSGFEGLVISSIDAHFTFVKYAKLWQLDKQKNNGK
ncbi:MAG: glycosyltransferase family 2 protein [Cytophagales bacterium]|nr:MAG: glycosyltransferase family 2 protein [Cytophagales bacterium]